VPKSDVCRILIFFGGTLNTKLKSRNRLMKQHTKWFATAVAVTSIIIIANTAQSQSITGTPNLSNIDTTFLPANSFGGFGPATFTSTLTGLEISTPAPTYGGTFYAIPIAQQTPLNSADTEVTFDFTFNSPAGPYAGGVNVQFALDDSMGGSVIYSTGYNPYSAGSMNSVTLPLTGANLSNIAAGALINGVSFFIDPVNIGGAYDITENSLTLTPAPEPTTLALAGLGGAAGLLTFRRRNR
jgi:hypothetical protein